MIGKIKDNALFSSDFETFTRRRFENANTWWNYMFSP